MILQRERFPTDLQSCYESSPVKQCDSILKEIATNVVFYTINWWLEIAEKCAANPWTGRIMVRIKRRMSAHLPNSNNTVILQMLQQIQ
jgi:hypothetical protein